MSLTLSIKRKLFLKLEVVIKMGKFQIDTLIQEKTKTCFVDFKKEHSLKENILNCVACMEYEFKQRVMEQQLCGTYYTKGLALINEFKGKVKAAVLPEKIEPGWLYCVEMNSYSIKLVATWTGKGALQGITDNFVRLSVAAKLLSLKEYSKLYGLHPNSVRQLIRRGYIANPLKQETDWLLSELVVPPLLKKQRPRVRQYEAITPINGYVGKLEFLNGYAYIRIEKDMKNKRYSKITLWKRKMAAMEAPLVMHLEEQEKATLELSLITDQNIIGEDGNAAIYVLAA